MRPIKFRAWDKDTETMFIPEYISGDGKVYEDIGVSFQQELSERKNVILLQFTGLKDRSGREIYEGDILENGDWVPDAHTTYTWKTEVKFIDGCYCGIAGEVVEVIGNIYENPELLEEQK